MSNYFDEVPGSRDTERAYGWLFWVIAVVFVALVLIGVLAFGLRWQNAVLNQYGPERSEQLSREANDRWQALLSAQASIVQVRRALLEFNSLYGEDASRWPQGKRQEFQQMQANLTNLIQSYNGQCGQYNALWRDTWRDVPAPNDLPKECQLLTR